MTTKPSSSSDGADRPDATRDGTAADRSFDLDTLKAFAHPMRVQIFDILSQYGPATASGLAERLGESRGAISYHLRQLARHGFVRELEGRGTTRERWWERTPGGINLETTKLATTPAGRIAVQCVMRQWAINREALLHDFVEHGLDRLPERWVDAASTSTANLRLTSEQLKEISAEWMRFSTTFLDRYRGQNLPGSRPVQIQFNAFPLIDGEETPE